MSLIAFAVLMIFFLLFLDIYFSSLLTPSSFRSLSLSPSFTGETLFFFSSLFFLFSFFLIQKKLRFKHEIGRWSSELWCAHDKAMVKWSFVVSWEWKVASLLMQFDFFCGIRDFCVILEKHRPFILFVATWLNAFLVRMVTNIAICYVGFFFFA